MRLANMKAGRKGNLNVATEVNDPPLLVMWDTICHIIIVLLKVIIEYRYFKWHLPFTWLRSEKQKAIHWSSIRFPSSPFFAKLSPSFHSLCHPQISY